MTPAQGQAVLADNFAPWVLALNLRVTACDANSATLRMPFDDKLLRVGGIVCGQALMAAADTAMVIAICAALGGMRPMATVSQNISFLRTISGAPGQDVEITARVLKAGKSLVFGEVEIRVAGDERVGVHATTTYALMG